MLSIVIPSHNRATRLRLCLDALRSAISACGGVREVVVVNDASEDDTQDVCRRFAAEFPIQFQFHDLRVNCGRSISRNVGASFCNGDRILFLDNDILVDQKVLRRHQTLAGADTILSRATILHLPWLQPMHDPAVCDHELPTRLAGRRLNAETTETLLASARRLARRSAFESDLHRLLKARPEEVSGRWLAATGGNLSISRRFFQQLRGFDENMGRRWGMEDLEFGYRAELAGGRIRHFSDVHAFHMDHPGPRRAADHAMALDYFAGKHGRALGKIVTAYFTGEIDILEVNEQ